MDGIRVGEDVVSGLPVGMLVGGAKARYPECRRISECLTEVCRRSPGPCRGFKRIDDRNRIVAEKALGQHRVIRPIAGFAGGGEESGQVQRSLLAQSDEIDGLAPSRPFLSPPSCRQLADHARQHIGRVLPADEAETLEGLVDESSECPPLAYFWLAEGAIED